MAGLTLSSNSSGLYLSSGTLNPVSVVAGVTVGGVVAYGLGSAQSVNWTVVNAGTIQSTGTGAVSDGILLQSTVPTTSYISNTSAGVIQGYKIGVSLSAYGTIVNQGVIESQILTGAAYGYTAAAGFYPTVGGIVMHGGRVTNAATALISGGLVGVAIGSGTVANAGTISASSSNAGLGVFLAGGGYVTNSIGGTIEAGRYGVLATGFAGVTNQGLIDSVSDIGGFFFSGGVVDNKAGGTITGTIRGLQFGGTAISSLSNEGGAVIAGGSDGVLGAVSATLNLVNAGAINGTTSSGVLIAGTGAVTNLSAGTISGGFDGFTDQSNQGISVSNAVGGTIVGGSYGIDFLGTGSAVATLVNDGVVQGVSFGGMRLYGATNIYNQSGGTIEGGVAGIRSFGTATVNVENYQGAVIAGGKYGVFASGGGFSLTNAGSVNGTAGIGVVLLGGGTVVNQSSGTILGSSDAIYASGTASSEVTNNGILTGTAFAGVLLQSGGAVTNNQTGTITALHYGIEVRSLASTVVNAGSIGVTATSAAAGIQVAAGGVVTNTASGRITGAFIGVQIGAFGTVSAGGTLFNQGSIYASNGSNIGAAVWIHGPGEIYNAANAAISGGPYGIVAYYQTTVVNNGSIGGTVWGFDAVNPGFADRVIESPGARFSGLVSGGNTIGAGVYSTLELASGSSTGTITNFGGQYIDFAHVVVDAGATWYLGGTVAAGYTVAFGGTNASLILGNPSAMAGTIADFVSTDTLVLNGITDVTGLSFGAGNTLTVSESSGPGISIQFAAAQPLFFSTSGGATAIVACFAKGTRIQTDDGPVPVEDLRVGMPVQSIFGGSPAIVWIGQRHVDCAQHPNPRTVWPVLIEAGAFGPGLPAADLRLSPDHAVYVNKVLIPVRYLLNGTTIRQIAIDEVTYYHVELPEHDVLLAEGLPTESFLDTGNRANFADSVAPKLFPDFATPPPNLAVVWEFRGCAPLIVHGAELEAARRLVNREIQTAA